jgi:hypothetical protein
MFEDVTNWINATSLEYWEAFAFWFQYVFPKQLHSVFLWIEQTAVWQWIEFQFKHLPMIVQATIIIAIAGAVFRGGVYLASAGVGLAIGWLLVLMMNILASPFLLVVYIFRKVKMCSRADLNTVAAEPVSEFTNTTNK